ncbi:MAG: MarR family transcriptional regulator [Rhizobiales bacterium]|nr:MarR family transcriptional regulator [Hyphomicrobiales bacterium]
MREADENAGVVAVARLLARLAGQPGATLAALAAELEIARSTAFAVADELEAADFIERDARGIVSPGAAAARLGLARFGFGMLAAPAGALLPVLRDDTDASAQMVVAAPDGEAIAFERRAAWDGGADDAMRTIEAPVARSARGHECRLRLRLRPNATEAEIRSASACLQRVAAALGQAG